MRHSASTSIIIDAPLARVWDALTQPALVKQYFFGTNLVTDWSIGSPLFFRGEWQGKAYEDKGTVLAFEAERKLSYNYWSPFSGTPDTEDTRTLVRYTVREESGGVCVTIEQTNFDTQARADDSAKNWTQVLGQMKALLEAR